VAVLLCSVGAMARVVNVRPVCFWDLWCQSVVEVVAGRNDYAVEVVVGVGVGEGFDYVVVMVVVEVELEVVVDEGFDYVVELLALADGGCPGCIASL
jgi:hypothetical protein